MYLLEFEVTGCSLALRMLTEVFAICCCLFSFDFVSLSFEQKILAGEKPVAFKVNGKAPTVFTEARISYLLWSVFPHSY